MPTDDVTTVDTLALALSQLTQSTKFKKPKMLETKHLKLDLI